VITPLALAAALIPADWILEAAAWLVEWLLRFLEWCASLPGALWQGPSPPLWSVVLAFAGVAWLLAPRGLPWRAGGLALMAPAFALPPPSPAPGEAWVSALDVGQGLAVAVRTANHTLLFDAGPSFGGEEDSGSRIVVPMLRGAGRSRLDAVVLSHEDSDHIGGAQSVLEAMETDAVVSSLAPEHPLNALAGRALRCVRGMAWEWDGVRFAMLHPAPDDAPARRNDSSCVLRISTAGGSVLLAADIERAAEAQLLEREGAALKSEVLLVPHHGSRSSSTAPFVAAVAPRWALIAVGYRNRFRHPSADVLARYRAAGSEVLRTDADGAVTVMMSGGPTAVLAERARRARYWLQ
jgi:competence protein ComEC